MKTATTLQKTLTQRIRKPLKLIVNQNSSTLIKVQFKQPIHASIHEAFLAAPEPVLSSLASFINGDKNQTEKLYAFIGEYAKNNPLQRKDASQGRVYDLSILFQDLNKKFFHSKLSLKTEWWQKKRTPRFSCTLGLFVDLLQLIKIDSLLDHRDVPQYVVESILYHEMLHAALPQKQDSLGRFIAHTPEFKKRELAFPHFYRAEDWLRKNGRLFIQ